MDTMKDKPGLFNLRLSEPMKVLLYTIVLCGLILMMGSCVSLDKAVEKVTENEGNAKVANQAIKEKWEQVVAANCATWYPIKESTETDTETITGNSEELKKELRQTQALADSLKQAMLKIPVKPECRPEVLVRDNVIRQLQSRIQTLNSLAENLRADVQRVTTTKTQESRALARELEVERDRFKDSLNVEKTRHHETQVQLDQTEKKANTYFWGLVAVGVIGMVLLALKFFKPF